MRPLLIALFLTIIACAKPGVANAQRPSPDRALSEQVLSSVVRVDVGGSFHGSGVVVTPQGHVIVALRTIQGYEYSPVTVTSSRFPARVVAVDRRHEVAVLLAQRPPDQADQPMPFARLDTPSTTARDDRIRLAGYADTGSEPAMIARRTCPARVADPHFRGESADDHDVDDLLIIRQTDTPDRLRTDGMPVFSSGNGDLLGILIGRTGYGTSELIAMPATKLAAVLSRLNIALPNGS